MVGTSEKTVSFTLPIFSYYQKGGTFNASFIFIGFDWLGKGQVEILASKRHLFGYGT